MSDEPKKKRRKKAQAPETSKEQSSFPPQPEDIRELINDILSVRTQELKKQKLVKDSNNALVTTISEFLNCFMLIGYDDQGTPIAITKSTSQVESDALHTLLMKFFGLQMQKFGGNKGGYGGDDF